MYWMSGKGWSGRLHVHQKGCGEKGMEDGGWDDASVAGNRRLEKEVFCLLVPQEPSAVLNIFIS